MPYTGVTRSVGRYFAIRPGYPNSVSSGKPAGDWAMDWKADGLLCRFHRRKSKPAHCRESCRHHAIRRIRTGVWLGSTVARGGRSAGIGGWSFEIWDALRRRVEVEYYLVPVADRRERHAPEFRRRLAWHADPYLPADETSAIAGLRLRRQNTFRQHGRWLGIGACGSRVYFPGKQGHRTLSF